MKILSFDIEDWFHLLEVPGTTGIASWDKLPSRIGSGVDRILDVLEERDTKATFFILGWIAETYPAVIQRISDKGHDIGSHSYDHRLVHQMDSVEFRHDLARSKKAIENTTGVEVTKYRAPGFSITPKTLWAFECLIETGYTMDCSIFPARRAHGGMGQWPAIPHRIQSKSGELKALPISIWRFGNLGVPTPGGGYFRATPYWLTHAMVARQVYTMLYFHPRDFDQMQPRLKGLSIWRYWKTYVGLGSALGKLEKVVEHFEFTTVAEANNNLEWDSTPSISV